MKSLTGESIKELLKTETLGKVIYSFEEVSSTNDIALELGRNGACEGTIVIADSQSGGRGRLGRRWISPPGVNLYTSVIFRPRIATKDAPVLTLISAISVAEALRAEGAVGATIKWPNDLIINMKKVAGILTEMETKEDEVDFIVVGIGVNLNMTGEMMKQEMGEVADMATSLREVVGHEIERKKFTSSLISKLDVWYQSFLNGGKPLIIKRWMEMWEAIHRRVRVSFDERIIEGIASGIDEDGYLILQRYDGRTEKVISGDVIFL
jgi:BirA family transcriptional regulator, biotin operon repressor / biotin---[acetyl-CoA-carboxylase] ligase